MSWRDHVRVHPAADVFPLLQKPELQKLADDILANRLQQGVVMLIDLGDGGECLLDGRNRLDALELAGFDVIGEDGKIKREYLASRMPTSSGTDPAAWIVSANIHRRHLSKRQQADLIVAAVKAGKTDRAKLARSVRREAATGRVSGTTKDPVKEKVVELAAEHGISERTATRALVEAEPERQRPKARTAAQIREEQRAVKKAADAVHADTVANNLLQTTKDLQRCSVHLTAAGLDAVARARELLLEIDPTTAIRKVS